MKTIIVLASVATVCLITVWVSSKLVIFRGAPFDGRIRRDGEKRMKGRDWYIEADVLNRINSTRLS